MSEIAFRSRSTTHEVDRVGVRRQQRRRQVGERALRVDQAGELFGVGLVEQPPGRDVGEGGVGQRRVAVAEGEARGLGQEVQPLLAVRVERRQVELLQDVEHQQRHHALAVGRALVDVDVAVAGVDRLHLLGRRCGEVLHLVPAAGRVQARHHLLGQLALVEGVGPLLGDAPQRAGERRQADDAARLRRLAARQVEGLPGLGERDAVAVALPVPGDARRHREALLGVPDRGLEQLAERAGAVRPEQVLPGGDGARHGDAVRARRPQLLDAGRAQRVDGEASGRPAGAVQRLHAARGRGVEGEAVAADAGHLRLDHAQHRDRRHRRVGRVAARAHHLQRRQRGERVRGRRHRLAGVGRRAARLVERAHAAHSSVVASPP